MGWRTEVSQACLKLTEVSLITHRVVQIGGHEHRLGGIAHSVWGFSVCQGLFTEPWSVCVGVQPVDPCFATKTACLAGEWSRVCVEGAAAQHHQC